VIDWEGISGRENSPWKARASFTGCTCADPAVLTGHLPSKMVTLRPNIGFP
jgi:hypothetical protein